MYTSTIVVNFELEDKEYEAQVEVTVSEDMNYGADADGNRGTYASKIENIEVLGTVYCHTDMKELEIVTDGMYDKICKTVEDQDLIPDELESVHEMEREDRND